MIKKGGTGPGLPSKSSSTLSLVAKLLCLESKAEDSGRSEKKQVTWEKEHLQERKRDCWKMENGCGHLVLVIRSRKLCKYHGRNEAPQKQIKNQPLRRPLCHLVQSNTACYYHDNDATRFSEKLLKCEGLISVTSQH